MGKIIAFILCVGIIGFIPFASQQQCSNLPLPPLQPDYTPKGQVLSSAGMDTYETGNLSSRKALIAVYDIYGFTPATNNVFQICDYLGDLGYRVIMPDFFHGVPWKGELHPSSQEYNDWMKATSWDESVRADLILVLDEYKRQNVTEFGLFGFCFGGKIAAHATAEFYNDIRVAGHFHPATVNISDAPLIRSPTILLPGANDPDLTEYCDIIKANNGNNSCVYHHMRDVNHGYSGGIANWTNCTLRTRAQDAVKMFTEFLCEHFPA